MVFVSKREYTLFCTAFFFISPCSSYNSVISAFTKSLLECFCFHNVGMHFTAVLKWRDIHLYTFWIGVNYQVKAKFFCPFVTKLYHLTELPQCVNMQKRKRRLTGSKRFHRQMQHNGTVFTDTVHHDRIAKLCCYFTKYVDGFRFELFKMSQPFFCYHIIFHSMLYNLFQPNNQ